MGRSEQRRRKLEHGDALLSQAVIVGRFGGPQVERQRVLDRGPIIDSVDPRKRRTVPYAFPMTLPLSARELTEKD